VHDSFAIANVDRRLEGVDVVLHCFLALFELGIERLGSLRVRGNPIASDLTHSSALLYQTLCVRKLGVGGVLPQWVDPAVANGDTNEVEAWKLICLEQRVG
jgi:hypothetical protein